MEETSLEAFAIRLNTRYVATRFVPPIVLDCGRSTIKRLRGQNSRPFSTMRPFVHEILGSHSQCQEDLVVDAILGGKRQGFYVDIGANDPMELNNTLRFYKRGWNGINIEPLPLLFKRIQKHRPRDINLNLAVGPVDGEVDFYVIDPDTLSTLDSQTAHENLKRPGARLIEKRKIAVLRLETVFDRYLNNHGIDFMSLDVEGYEREVLIGNNWQKYRPALIIIEITYGGEQIVRMMEEHSYMLVYNNSLNGFFVDERSNILDGGMSL